MSSLRMISTREYTILNDSKLFLTSLRAKIYITLSNMFLPRTIPFNGSRSYMIISMEQRIVTSGRRQISSISSSLSPRNPFRKTWQILRKHSESLMLRVASPSLTIKNYITSKKSWSMMYASASYRQWLLRRHLQSHMTSLSRD